MMLVGSFSRPLVAAPINTGGGAHRGFNVELTRLLAGISDVGPGIWDLSELWGL
jgi:hypothetical protein